MMTRLIIIPILVLLAGCSANKVGEQEAQKTNSEPTRVVSEHYELIIPDTQDGFLILFPCFPCDAENTRTEFNITEIALSHNIAVLFMNFNQHLWLTDSEKRALEEIILGAVDQHDIPIHNTFIGGFSSGGNVAVLLTDYLNSTASSIQPRGLFIADSPVDLLGLYENAQKNIRKNFSAPAVEEAKWIVEKFEREFGIGDSSMVHYEHKSPYISKTNSTKNIGNLEGVKIRLYTEPDTLWWKENRQTDYEDMNAYYLSLLAHDMRALYGENNVAYIQTENRGYRANGERHPHSWSIVDENDFVNWVLTK